MPDEEVYRHTCMRHNEFVLVCQHQCVLLMHGVRGLAHTEQELCGSCVPRWSVSYVFQHQRCTMFDGAGDVCCFSAADGCCMGCGEAGFARPS